MRRPRTHRLHAVGNQPLVSPLCDPALAFRRTVLVNDLFKYVEEIRNLNVGYAFRFCRSHNQDNQEELIGTIANYILFESRNSPQVTFHILEKPHDQTFWLQIRNIVRTRSTSNTCTILDCSESSLLSPGIDPVDPEGSPQYQRNMNCM